MPHPQGTVLYRCGNNLLRAGNQDIKGVAIGGIDSMFGRFTVS